MVRLAAPVDADPAAAPPLSLVAASRNGDTAPRWENGITYLPEPQSGHGTLDPCAFDAGTLGEPVPPDLIVYDPFGVWAADGCTTMQSEAEDWRARALRLLEAATPWEVGREFWRGDQAEAHNGAFPGDLWANRYLTDGNATDLTGAGAADAVDALACLEEALTEGYGARGMIHATRKVATLWQAANLLRREGRLLLTAFDTIVVPDAGYDGTGEDGNAPAAGEQWAFATDMVKVRLGEPVPVPAGEDGPASAVRFDVNKLVYRAERLAAVTFDGIRHFGIRVAVPACGQ